MKNWFNSIANQLSWGLLGLVILSLSGTGSILIYSSFQTQLRQTNQLQKERSQAAADKIDVFVEDWKRKLSYLARVRGLTDLPPTTQQTILEGLTRHDDAYELVAILDNQGKPVVTVSPYGDTLEDNLANSPLFINAFKQQDNYVAPVAIDNKTDFLVTTIAVPIRNQQDEVAGVLLAKINLKFLKFIVSQADIGKTGYIYVIDNRKFLIAEKGSNTKNFQIEDLSQKAFIANLTSTREKPLKLYTGLQDVEVLGAMAPVSGVDWNVIVELPTAEAYAPVYSLLKNMAIALTIVILITAFIGYLFSRRIVVPLQYLTAAADEISKGKLNVKLKIASRNELGLLAQIFNHMAAQLNASFAALEKTNAELETRVEERTLQLKQAKEIADSANNAKSEFLANMSHELRTPLNGILGYAQILQRQDTTPKQKDGLAIIHQCGSHLLNLINDILDLSKIEARKLELYPQDIHFQSFLTGVSEICRIKAEQKEINFNFESVNQLPVAIHADEKRLSQVLINLLGNAIKFTEKGGVTLKAEVIENQHPIYQIRFQIEDTGVGMTSEQIDKIFLPFEQVGDNQRKAEGTGLGLAISLQIVEMMGSRLQLKSTYGEGTTFWFDVDLEAGENPVESAVLKSSGVIGYQGKSIKILIVDDRWENRSVIINMLEPLEFQIFEANNGEEGIEKALQLHPDLIITDLAMPIVNGFEMTNKLREIAEFEKIPIIASSASVFNFDRQQSQKAGCNDFLIKPVQLEELLAQLQTYLELTWIYDDAEIEVQASKENLESSDIVPPIEELAVLYEAAQDGFIAEIIEEANRLKNSNSQYTCFANKILKLAQDFDDEAILDLLEQIK